MSDVELLEHIKQGDESAFRNLIEKYEPKVASIVIRMLGNTPEAEDVGQETFIRFFESLENFRGDSGIGTYLSRIAINLSLNELKRRKRRSFFSLGSQDKHLELEDENSRFEKHDAKQTVDLALRKLDDKFRAVIILRLIEGYSTEETAKILNLPIGTVLSRLARGQKKLKEIIEQWESDYE